MTVWVPAAIFPFVLARFANYESKTSLFPERAPFLPSYFFPQAANDTRLLHGDCGAAGNLDSSAGIFLPKPLDAKGAREQGLLQA